MELKTTLPSQLGIHPELIINFLNACEKENSEIHGIMIAKDDHIIFEAYNAPYEAGIPHIMHSFTKTLTNTAVALAYTDGLLSLSDSILKFFPEYADSANKYLKRCTIFNLITMRSGQARSIGGNEWRPLKSSWKDAYFQVPFDKMPGTEFMYSSGNSYILSYIVQKLTGKTCCELIKERISTKLGLSDFPWMLSPEGVCSGGNGTELTTEDMLRIGLLYLHRGKWNGEQLIAEEWFDYAFGDRDAFPPVNGLQYNFHWEHTGEIWAARGMFGQTCGIIPSRNMVFAITAADENYKAMQLFQQEIPDHLEEKVVDLTSAANLEEILLQKGLRMTLEAKNVSVAEHLTPKSDYVFLADENTDGITSIELHFSPDTIEYVVADFRGRHSITAGYSHWHTGTTSMTGAYLHHQYEKEDLRICANAFWSAKNVLTLEWRYPEMAFFDHLTIQFEDSQVRVNRWVNMNSQDRRRPELVLKIERGVS